ncbi:MAG TPA: PKD domain-containing protein, partial [Desulfarculaceae bacterium]|nr:PKD domain-containing protein [Desulfarculaceae bacterium]
NWMDDEPSARIIEKGTSTIVEKEFLTLMDSSVINSWGTAYRWDFGDGSSPQGPFSDSSISHTYARPGNYQVRVETTDNWGNRAIGKYLVVRPDCLYYPHVATVNDWETEICIINSSNRSTITGDFKAYADDGTLVSEINDVVLSPRARREITVGTTFTDPDRIGYIIFTANSDTIVGYTKFYCSGDYRVAIPAVKELNHDNIFISHIASDDNWFTGLSLVNVTASARTLFIESDNSLKRTLVLAPGEHKALSIRSLFSNQPQPGIKSAVIRNSAGIIGLELFGSGQQLSGILLQDHSTKEILYPHVVSTDAWWTGVVAYNCTAEVGRFDFTTFNAAGKILSTVHQNLDGHDKFMGSITSLGFPETTAWFRIKSSQSMTGFELFGTSNGLQLAGYSSIKLSATKGVFAKLEKQGFTGIAMVNASSLKARVRLSAYSDDGHMVGSLETINLAGYEKVVKVVEELFSSDITNATYIIYDSDRKIVGFQLNGSNDGMLLDGLPALR